MGSEEQRQVSVWVGQEEKLVFGLSKRTTCADVARALLLDTHQPSSSSSSSKVSKILVLPGEPRSWCIVEHWRGLERVLPDDTRLLRLWDAWGAEEQDDVTFVLVQREASVGHHGASRSAEASVGHPGAIRSAEASVGHHGASRSAEARVVRSKDSPRIPTVAAASSAAMCFSPGKQRRIVTKAFRKLEKMNKKKARAASRDATVERMETMVHRVISQDRALRQQLHRIHELDEEIESYETRVHVDRMKSHGVNYVQDTYSVDGLEGPSTRDGVQLSSVDEIMQENLEEYVRRCQEVIALQERLEDHQALADSMTRAIQEELNRRWMERRRREETVCVSFPSAHLTQSPGVCAAQNNFLFDHVERVRTELDTSLYIGLRLDTDLHAIEKDLQLTQEALGSREREIHALLMQMNTLDADEETLTLEECNNDNVPKEKDMVCSLEAKSGWMEQTSQDDDSDTGISSLHSQDSDTCPIISLTVH